MNMLGSDRVALLRLAAEGRREYAAQLREDEPNPALREARTVLLSEAATLDLAARLMEGDNSPLYGWLPSWRWTDEMTEALNNGAVRG